MSVRASVDLAALKKVILAQNILEGATRRQVYQGAVFQEAFDKRKQLEQTRGSR